MKFQVLFKSINCGGDQSMGASRKLTIMKKILTKFKLL